MTRRKHAAFVAVTSLLIVSEAQLPSRKADATTSEYHIKLMARSPGLVLLHIDGVSCRPVRFSDLFFDGLRRPFILHFDQSIAPEYECLSRQLSACLNKCRRIDHCNDGHYSDRQPTPDPIEPILIQAVVGPGKVKRAISYMKLIEDYAVLTDSELDASVFLVTEDGLSAERRPDLLKWRLAGRRVSDRTE
jgi:hypothetical protein